MNGAAASLFRVFALLSLALAQTVGASDNQTFAFGLAGVRPVTWADYEPIQRDSIACLKDNRMSTPVCEQVFDKGMSILWDAFKHAVLVNALANPDAKRFCDKGAEDIVRNGKVSDGAAYAILLIDERLKYGSSLYGKELPSTYVAKLVFDALMDTKPCK